MNTNQLLQTSRTVTFLIAKNKEQIPNFVEWHQSNVSDAWAHDQVMKWAKDSRNFIEKEGDLELHSTLRVTLMCSYLDEEDSTLDVGRSELLGAGIKKLIRLAQKRLPTAVFDAAALRVERKWVTASLSNLELLHALSIVYLRLEECCRALSRHLGTAFPEALSSDHNLDNLLERARGIRYIKLRTRRPAALWITRMTRDESFKPSKELEQAATHLRSLASEIKDLPSALAYFEVMAPTTFAAFGNHVPMLFVYDEKWQIVSQVSTEFEDQVDKYIFWRSLAERVHNLRAYALVWISESWIRDLKTGAGLPIRKMPIKGEVLHVVGVTKLGELRDITWKIVRTDGNPSLERTTEAEYKMTEAPFFFVPAMKAMGIAEPQKVRLVAS